MNRRSFFGAIAAGALAGTSKPVRKVFARFHVDMRSPKIGDTIQVKVPIRFKPWASHEFTYRTDEFVPVTQATKAEIEFFRHGTLSRL